MPSKIDFNGLDNANVWFDHVNLGLDAMLTGISSVSTEGVYELADPKVPFRFVEVAQRLLSGRICIAGAAVNQVRITFICFSTQRRKAFLRFFCSLVLSNSGMLRPEKCWMQSMSTAQSV